MNKWLLFVCKQFTKLIDTYILHMLCVRFLNFYGFTLTAFNILKQIVQYIDLWLIYNRISTVTGVFWINTNCYEVDIFSRTQDYICLRIKTFFRPTFLWNTYYTYYKYWVKFVTIIFVTIITNLHLVFNLLIFWMTI